MAQIDIRALLGIGPETTFGEVDRVYIEERGRLIANGASPTDSVIRDLDAAYEYERGEGRAAKRFTIDRVEVFLQLPDGGLVTARPSAVARQASETIVDEVLVLSVSERGRKELPSLLKDIEAWGGVGTAARVMDGGAEVPAVAVWGVPQARWGPLPARVAAKYRIVVTSTEIRVTDPNGFNWARHVSLTGEGPIGIDDLWGPVRERRDQRKAQAHERAERKRLLAEAGWPPSWSERQCQRWTDAGGTAETATELARNGWSAGEAAEVLVAGIDPSHIDVPANAGLQRQHGLSLVEIVSGTWPAVEASTVLSVRRLKPNGERNVTSLIEQAGTFGWVSSVSNGGRWNNTDGPLAESLEEALSEPGGHLTCAPGEAVQVLCPSMAPHAILDALTFTDFDIDVDPAAWPTEVADEWDDGGYLPEAFSELALSPRWITVNGFTVAALAVAGGEMPVLVDSGEDQLMPRRELVSHSWFSESGGAPISWDGGNSISELAPGILLTRQWGDLGHEVQVASIPRDDEAALAVFIAGWAVESQAEVAWALENVVLDPHGSLDEEQRTTWVERIISPTLYLEYEFPKELVDAVSQNLLGSERFARLASALTEPLSEEGVALATVLDEYMEHGVLGELLGF